MGLKVLVHSLTAQTAKRDDDLKEIQAMASKQKEDDMDSVSFVFEELNRARLTSVEDPDLLLGILEQKLNSLKSSRAYWGALEIPDLVSLAGPAKAEAFLRKALTNDVELQLTSSETPTMRLAQKLALEMVDRLKRPQWELVKSLDSLELYEAMEKKFGKSAKAEATPPVPGLILEPPVDAADPTRYQKEAARMYYFLGLIAKGRTQEAISVAENLSRNGFFPPEVLKEMERAGLSRQLNDFLRDLLTAKPETPLWADYVRIAAHAGDTPRMVKLVRETIAKPVLSEKRRNHLRQVLYAALLADDDVDEGVKELRLRLSADPDQLTATDPDFLATPGALALQLAKIGHLLGNTNWLEEGLKRAKEFAAEKTNPAMQPWGVGNADALARFLSALGRGAEAEEVLANALHSQLSAGQEEQAGAEWTTTLGAPGTLISLVRLYHAFGREADSLELFERAPYWGAKDLAGLNATSMSFGEEAYRWHRGTQMVSVPLAYFAATALTNAGRIKEARILLDQALTEAPGSDPLYELLLPLDDTNAPTRLDALFALDPFEERPLIWKAHWLRLHQKLEEAEREARRAIAIDPTDGEEPKGDRLRAYAELAEIRAARGDAKEAAELKGAVQAVRQAEAADDLMEAGLLKRAVKAYEDSLVHFADAYCIHARLAVQLSDLGRHQEAEEHYRRAYELMPDSFGRVESHCFGCERAFDGERAQSIAESVFAKMAQANPNKPQVHYLLGYLRDEQQRYKEAAESYRIAVKLDPDYLNAWAKLDELSQHYAIPASERDAIAFNLLRLDPNGRHSHPSLTLVSDLAGLWRVCASIQSKRPEKPHELLALPASALELQKHKNPAASMLEQRRSMVEAVEGRGLTPGRAIARNPYVNVGGALIFRGRGNMME